MNRILAMLWLFVSVGSVQAAPPASQPTTGPSIKWESWSPAAFEKAKKENRYVILDLEAVWCHWCHVMDETTYADGAVQALMNKSYVPVRVDQDSRPDLANRYEDYGWPATIVFDGSGREIVRRRGYIPPADMISLLQAIIDDPSTGPSVTAPVEVKEADAVSLTPETRIALIKRLKAAYDDKEQGWGRANKYVDPDVIEYCLSYGDADLQRMATSTLGAMRQLIDPAWGGVYQYSTDGDWQHPHFEKIMSYQSEDLRIYSMAHLASGNAADLQSARDIDRFLENFLAAPTGAFYTSQDADLVQGEHAGEYFKLSDAERRRIGVPRVDTHVYSRENGWAIRGLVARYADTGDASVLDRATKAAHWIIDHRAIDDGGFRHDTNDAAGPYLGDTLSMGRAFLALYGATADRSWLSRAQACAHFIAAHFVQGSAGLVTAQSTEVGPAAPRPELDENIAAARFLNLLFAFTGNAEDKQLSRIAMRYVAAPQVSEHVGWSVGGILLADREMSGEPLHIAVVGSKSDPAAAELFKAAVRVPTYCKRVEWFDAAEGPLPHADVEYPTLPTAAAFICTGNACSSPVKTPAALEAKLHRATPRP